jgi:serine/threonine protein kinase
MDISINCPYCLEELIAKMSDCGHEVECSSCQKEFTIPLQKTLVAGNVVDDHVIIKQIGEGSMGQVFLAEHVLMGRRVALKTISPQSECEGGTAKQFIQELQHCAILEHANIVTTYSAGMQNELLYLTMQFIEGDDVSDLLSEQGKLPLKESLKVLKSIADALDYAWSEHSMMHRDVKPENIRKNKRGDYILMDFGLASIGQTENDGFVYGTPDFISPEQAQLKELDFRTDMYALGLVTMNLLTGKRPFVGEPEEVLHMQIKQVVPSLYEFDPELERVQGLSELIAGMVEKDPRDRWTSWEMLTRKIDVVIDQYENPKAAVKSKAPTSKKPKTKTGPKALKKKPGIKVSGAQARSGRRSIQATKGSPIKMIIAISLLILLLCFALTYVGLLPDFFDIMKDFKPWVNELMGKPKPE